MVKADATDENALRQIGVPESSRAVVGIGTDIEASVLTVLSLVELGASEIGRKPSAPNTARFFPLSVRTLSSTLRPRWAIGSRT